MQPPTRPKSLLEDTYDLSQMATIKVIIVPICPQKKSTFQSYVGHFKKFATLALAELTPPDSQTGMLYCKKEDFSFCWWPPSHHDVCLLWFLAKYSEEFYHDGSIHYEFVTSYNRDLAQLEEIEISRQILGVRQKRSWWFLVSINSTFLPCGLTRVNTSFAFTPLVNSVNQIFYARWLEWWIVSKSAICTTDTSNFSRLCSE